MIANWKTQLRILKLRILSTTRARWRAICQLLIITHPHTSTTPPLGRTHTSSSRLKGWMKIARKEGMDENHLVLLSDLDDGLEVHHLSLHAVDALHNDQDLSPRPTSPRHPHHHGLAKNLPIYNRDNRNKKQFRSRSSLAAIQIPISLIPSMSTSRSRFLYLLSHRCLLPDPDSHICYSIDVHFPIQILISSFHPVYLHPLCHVSLKSPPEPPTRGSSTHIAVFSKDLT